jgi:signal peptidase II
MPRADSRWARWLAFLVTVPVVVVADQVTKAWIRSYPEGHVFFQRGFFEIVRIQNTGAAFGLFRGSSLPLMIVDFVAIVLILAYFLYFADRIAILRNRPGWIALSLIFAGTAGNLIDRLRPGMIGITDFIYFTYWPAFNIADSAITVGVIVLALSLLFVKEGPETEANPKHDIRAT